MSESRLQELVEDAAALADLDEGAECRLRDLAVGVDQRLVAREAGHRGTLPPPPDRWRGREALGRAAPAARRLRRELFGQEEGRRAGAARRRTAHPVRAAR